MVSLAFDEERRNSPYYLLSLVAEPEMAGGSASSAFRAALAERVSADGGQLLWRGTTIQVVQGRIEDEWQHVQLFEFSRGGEFVQMLTSTGYRAILNTHAELNRLMLGTGDAPDGIVAQGASVFGLYSVGEGDSLEFAQGVRELAGNLGEFNGKLIWDAPVAGLERDVQWNRLLLFEFASVAAAEDWLRDPATVTQRTLIQRATTGVVTLILQSS